MKRIATMVAVGLAAALLLSGCISLTGDITLNKDARASGTMDISIDKNMASLGGITSLEQFQQEMEKDESAESLPFGANNSTDGEAKVSYKESDTSYITNVELKNVKLDNEDFKAVRENDKIKFTYKSSADSGVGSQSKSAGRITSDTSLDNNDADGDMSSSEFDAFGESMGDAFASGLGSNMGSVSMTVAFPGDIETISGAEKIDDRTVKFSGSFTEPFHVEVTSGVGGLSTAILTVLVVGGLALLGLLVLAVVLVLVVLLRKKKSNEADSAPYGVAPDSPDSDRGSSTNGGLGGE